MSTNKSLTKKRAKKAAKRRDRKKVSRTQTSSSGVARAPMTRAAFPQPGTLAIDATSITDQQGRTVAAGSGRPGVVEIGLTQGGRSGWQTMDDDIQLEIARRYCINGADLSLPESRPSWFTARLDEMIRQFRRDGQYLQLPSFYGAEAIGIFSDYGGAHAESRFETYSFLFADHGGLEVFDERVKAIRDSTRLPRTREISFKALREGNVVAVVPEVLRAADTIPGLLFTLAVEKSIGSILSGDPNTRASIQQQLRSIGLQSWTSHQDAERLGRVLHSVAYWLSLLGRRGMKTLWMSDNDAIHGRSEFPDDFESAYLRVLPLFNAPEFSILGIAKSFKVDAEQPYLHEAVSVSDLVAGAIAAYLTEQRGVPQSERRGAITADIITFLGHQSPFLKKLTYVIQKLPDGTEATGLMRLTSTTRSTEGYFRVEF